MQAAPMARLQQKTQAAGTTGSARTTGIPCAMVSRFIRALPGVPGFLATVACQSSRQAWSQRRGIRTTRFRHPPRPRSSCAAQSVHRIPPPTFV